MKLSDQIRRAVEESGVSRYRIAKDLGLTQSFLSHFMHGRVGLSMDVLDRLADYLGFEIHVTNKAPTEGEKGRKGR